MHGQGRSHELAAANARSLNQAPCAMDALAAKALPAADGADTYPPNQERVPPGLSGGLLGDPGDLSVLLDHSQSRAVIVGASAGVAGRHSPHRWRHGHATSLVRRGEDVHVVQRLMGHSNIATTTRYLHLSDADLIEAIDREFPES